MATNKPGDINAPKIIKALDRLHKKYPTLSLTTIIQSAIDHKKQRPNCNLVDVSSKEFLAALETYGEYLEKKISKRTDSGPTPE